MFISSMIFVSMVLLIKFLKSVYERDATPFSRLVQPDRFRAMRQTTPALPPVVTTLRMFCGALTLAGLLMAYAFWPSARQAATDETIHKVATEIAAAHPVVAPPATEKAFEIDLADAGKALEGLTQREVDDQLRDWAVYGTLVHLGIGDSDVAKAMHRTAPVRRPYLDETVPYDHGRGRRALVGNRVLLFYEKGDKDRIATLGRLGDRVRMETGEVPASFEVFEASPDLDKGIIGIERRQAIPGKAMFGREYGYVEAEVDSLAKFTAWLGGVDDIAYARPLGNLVTLGGRRFEHSRTRTVTVDDVAALYQAQVELRGNRETSEFGNGALRGAAEEPGFSLDPQWRRAGLAELLDQLVEDPCRPLREARSRLGSEFKDYLISIIEESGAPPTAAEQEAAWTQFLKRIEVRNDDPKASLLSKVTLHLVELASTDGFEADCTRARKDYRELLQDTTTAVRASTTQHDLDRAMHQLEVAIEDAPRRGDTTSRLLGGISRYVMARQKVQCARYDGRLQGTRVGMNLFYTDLLAKVWASVDYDRSAPIRDVPGFLSTPRLDLDASWNDESVRLPSTRVWFGQKKESFTTSDGSMLFQHMATRVFAAGSGAAKSGAEEQPDEASRQSIGWWDKHFQAIAEYEQEFEVQNQIMKWSVLTGWLENRSAMPYLREDSVKVDRSQRFDRWFSTNKSSLRFKNGISLRPEGDWVTGTECIDLLASYGYRSGGTLWTVTGGVSLGGRAVAEHAPQLERAIDPALRLSTSIASEGAATEVGVGTSLVTRPKVVGAADVEVDLTSAVRARTARREITLGDKLHMSTKGAAAGELTVTLKGETEFVGEFRAGQVGDGVHLSWEGGVLEAAPGSAPPPLPQDPLLSAALAGDDASILPHLTAEAATDPEQVRALFDRSAASAQAAGDARLLTGDGAGARRLYDLGHAASPSQPKNLLRDALADIEGAAPQRGLDHLRALPAEMSAGDRAMVDSVAKRYNLDLEGLLHGRDIPGLPGARLEVAADTGSLQRALRFERPLEGSAVTMEQRIADVKSIYSAEKGAKPPEVVLYLDDRFSLNKVDMMSMGEGHYADLTKAPEVSWREMKAAGTGVEPEALLINGKQRYRRVPTAAEREGASQSGSLPPGARIILISRCDRDNPQDPPRPGCN
jgi:hypothetical protein